MCVLVDVCVSLTHCNIRTHTIRHASEERRGLEKMGWNILRVLMAGGEVRKPKC